jgi:hypothetical protein
MRYIIPGGCRLFGRGYPERRIDICEQYVRRTDKARHEFRMQSRRARHYARKRSRRSIDCDLLGAQTKQTFVFFQYKAFLLDARYVSQPDGIPHRTW